jgi:hypothetical protein
MAFCEAQDIRYVFGLGGNDVLYDLVDVAADDIRTTRALSNEDVLRGYAETRYAAKSWNDRERRVCARIEATRQGLDTRFVVTNIDSYDAETVYAELYCARGQAENLIKLHKTQLASDRTSCRSPLANQMRLVLHTAAYWLMLTVKDAIPAAHVLAKAEFTTIRLQLIKLGARIQETRSRVKIAFAAACPHAALFRQLAHALNPAAP